MLKKQLPKVNPKGKLEELSKRRIRSLFDVEKFEIKREEEKDTGIDWNVELIDEGYYTNYRFNLQLKAKAKYKVNKDGSVSKSLETYNIKYLLEGGIPAFYVFYVKENDEIYYEYVNDFVKKLEIEDKNWQGQDEHTCRFTKKMDKNALDRIYALVYQRSKELNENNETLIKINAALKDRCVNFDSYKEISQFLEAEGFQYLNNADSKLIIKLHENSNHREGNGRYNLLIGLAYENVGQYLKAVDYFNIALGQEKDLKPALYDFLKYKKFVVEYSLGFLDLEEFNNNLKLFTESNIIGLYLKLTQLRANYIIDADYEKFITELEAVYTHHNSNDVIKLYCLIEKLRIEGARLNAYYGQQVALINANWGKTPISAIEDFETEMAKNIAIWETEFEYLLNAIKKTQNKVVFYQCQLAGFSVIYELNVFVKYINFLNKGVQSFDDLNLFVDDYLTESIDYFRSIEYFEDLFSALEMKFKILHFLERYQEADEVAKELRNLANKAYSKERKKICDNLIERTPHYLIKTEMERILGKDFQEKQEWERIIEKMQKLDNLEPIDSEIKENFEICLFPIGNFKIDKLKVNIVFEILKIDNPSVKDTFLFMFDKGIVPIANILYDKVEDEGYREGNIAGKSVKNWRNIHRVRKDFFDNGFYRVRNRKNENHV